MSCSSEQSNSAINSPMNRRVSIESDPFVCIITLESLIIDSFSSSQIV